MTEEMKTCTHCGITRPISDFPRCKKSRCGRGSWCNPCKAVVSREYHWKNRDSCLLKMRAQHKKTEEATRWKRALYASKQQSNKRSHAPCSATEQEIIEAFTGKCHICGVPEQECSMRLHLDHDHETGAFRGWLCNGCNMAIGHARDNADILIRAAEYLIVSARSE